ncbi:carbohydrate ABC transporter permease [Dactylosporangium sp. AC04546]|uniref:carbohydrate ABC transporter permease n=1 Tax=Dactylosporangium sp. AC04546 TaxID=2862460 RepID=UPI001EDDAF9B|nr:carbohydrate ABC transporter permease [Dactylosporangium sp. AC04546]WVK79098.1 carbohydrate ABC transporter permease [Dactylosporangium sp. AC04546]
MRPRIAVVGWHAVLAGTVLAMLFPALWALLSSLKPANEIFGLGGFTPSVEHYRHALADWPIATLLENTLTMAAGVAAGQVVIAVLAAFALVHLAVPRGLVLGLLSVSLAIPPQALIIPQFLLAARLGWRNTDLGLIVPQLGASALAVLVLVQHVRAVPPSVVAAARLDGARPFELLWHIVLPALRPAIAAVAILVFISTWNEYLWPLLIAPRSADTTVQIGLTQFQTAEGSDYGGLLAAATLTSLPILLVYAVAARRITDAFLQTGLR